MIVVRIQIWPQGDEARQRELATIAIENIGGDAGEGDYAYAISNQQGATGLAYEGNPHELLTPLDKDGKKRGVPIWKQGIIRGFTRKSGAAKLLWRVLRHAFGNSEAHQ